jgi:hypothetical protein
MTCGRSSAKTTGPSRVVDWPVPRPVTLEKSKNKQNTESLRSCPPMATVMPPHHGWLPCIGNETRTNRRPCHGSRCTGITRQVNIYYILRDISYLCVCNLEAGRQALCRLTLTDGRRSCYYAWHQPPAPASHLATRLGS